MNNFFQLHLVFWSTVSFFPPIKWEKIHISVSVYREQTEWHRYFWNHFSHDFQRKKILITPRIFLQHFQVKRPCYRITNEKAWLRNNHKQFFLEKIDKKQLSSSQKLIEFQRAIKIFSRLFSFSEAAISQKKKLFFFLLRSQAAIFEVWVLHTYYNIKNAAAGRGGREDVQSTRWWWLLAVALTPTKHQFKISFFSYKKPFFRLPFVIVIFRLVLGENLVRNKERKSAFFVQKRRHFTPFFRNKKRYI